MNVQKKILNIISLFFFFNVIQHRHTTHQPKRTKGGSLSLSENEMDDSDELEHPMPLRMRTTSASEAFSRSFTPPLKLSTSSMNTTTNESIAEESSVAGQQQHRATSEPKLLFKQQK